MKWLDGITDSMDMNLDDFQEMEGDREDWRATVHGVAKSRTQLSDQTTTTTGEEPESHHTQSSSSNQFPMPQTLPFTWLHSAPWPVRPGAPW